MSSTECTLPGDGTDALVGPEDEDCQLQKQKHCVKCTAGHDIRQQCHSEEQAGITTCTVNGITYANTARAVNMNG